MKFQVIVEDINKNQKQGFIEAEDLEDVKNKIKPEKLIGAFVVLGTLKKEE